MNSLRKNKMIFSGMFFILVFCVALSFISFPIHARRILSFTLLLLSSVFYVLYCTTNKHEKKIRESDIAAKNDSINSWVRQYRESNNLRAASRGLNTPIVTASQLLSPGMTEESRLYNEYTRMAAQSFVRQRDIPYQSFPFHGVPADPDAVVVGGENVTNFEVLKNKEKDKPEDKSEDIAKKIEDFKKKNECSAIKSIEVA